MSPARCPLPRFVDPTAGSVRLGGVDLRELAGRELYRKVSFVFQDVRLLHASVADNIALAAPSATAQDVERAARLANIHDRVIGLPHGYGTVIGEEARLSGGEAHGSRSPAPCWPTPPSWCWTRRPPSPAAGPPNASGSWTTPCAGSSGPPAAPPRPHCPARWA